MGRGQRVGLCLERGADMLVAVLGVLKAGAAYVPLDPSFPEERLRFMAEDAQLALLVSSSALAGVFGLPRERQLLLDADAAAIAAQPERRLTPDAAAMRVPRIPPTSSTPRARPASPRAWWCRTARWSTSSAAWPRAPGLAADDVLVAVTTLSFDIAVLELLLPLTLGATVVIASRDEAMDGLALSGAARSSTRATVMQATPITWRLLLEAGWRGRRSASRRLVGGEALPTDWPTS